MSREPRAGDGVTFNNRWLSHRTDSGDAVGGGVAHFQRVDLSAPRTLHSSGIRWRLPGLLDAGAGSFAKRTCPHFRHVLTRSSSPDAATQYGAFPLRLVFWTNQRRRSMVAIRNLLFWSRSRVPRPDPTPGTASAGISLALISTPTVGWLQAGLCVPGCCPFV